MKSVYEPFIRHITAVAELAQQLVWRELFTPIHVQGAQRAQGGKAPKMQLRPMTLSSLIVYWILGIGYCYTRKRGFLPFFQHPISNGLDPSLNE
jgi:hypothetical protein